MWAKVAYRASIEAASLRQNIKHGEAVSVLFTFFFFSNNAVYVDSDDLHVSSYNLKAQGTIWRSVNKHMLQAKPAL